MKRIIFLIAIIFMFSGIIEAKPYFQTSVSFNIFHSSLSRYGTWIETDWGLAWRPLHVSHRWRPYLHGRWAWTDYGWYWVSYEPFGWATFHYGRWYYDDYYGWIWIPDYEWGPAWVEWRYNDDYIGWAPLPPFATFSINIGISFSQHWSAPIHYWNFIPCRNFTASRVDEYIQPIEKARRIHGSTRSGNLIRNESNRIFNSGVDVNFIEHKTKTRINRIEVIQNDKREGEKLIRDGKYERIEVYRPKIDDQIRSADKRPTTSTKPEEFINKDRYQPKRGMGQSLGDEERRTSIEKRFNNEKPRMNDYKDRQQQTQEIQRIREQKQNKIEQRKREERKIDQYKQEQKFREIPNQNRPQIQSREIQKPRERYFQPSREGNPSRDVQHRRRP